MSRRLIVLSTVPFLIAVSNWTRASKAHPTLPLLLQQQISCDPHYPSHREPNAPAAWRYYEILTKIRAE